MTNEECRRVESIRSIFYIKIDRIHSFDFDILRFAVLKK